MKLIPWLLLIVLLVACGGRPTPPSSTPTPFPTPTPLPGSMVITEPIFIELVRVPAGEFLMGSDPAKDTLAFGDERPQHPVTLAEFYIGKHEVTNAQYATFVEATGHNAPSHWENGRVPDGKEDHPVVNVSWYDAVAFTEWLGGRTGRAFRLCTEAEWEKACRGAESLIYPWGDTFDPDKANTGEAGPGGTTPAGSYSPAGDSPYGVADMSGNVWEWVADWYDGSYYGRSPTEDPPGPEKSGWWRVLRGGSPSYERLPRCAYRYADGPDGRIGAGAVGPVGLVDRLGFRVCASPGVSTPGQ